MKVRSTVLLIGSLLILILGGFIVMNGGGEDEEELQAVGRVEEPERAPETDETGESIQVKVGPTKVQERPKPLLPANPKAGIITGSIAVSTSILDKFYYYDILVLEDLNMNGRDPDLPPPFRKTERFPAQLELGTPLFEIQDIPFSKHNYVIRVQAPGVNGSEQRVYLSKEKPIGDVNLSLTPGTVYSVILRDQRQNPRLDLMVTMVPRGGPPNRPRHFGVTNNFGSVVFDNVVRGEYEIFVGRLRAPLALPTKVQVLAQAVASTRGGKPQPQGTTIEIPVGQNVTVEVSDQYSYLLEKAKLKVHQLEVSRYFAYEGETDVAGRFVFEHLPVGKYQLGVDSEGFGRRDLKFEVKEDEPAPVVKVVLRR